MQSKHDSVVAINAALGRLAASDLKSALEPGLELAQSILSLFVEEAQPSVEDIVADGLMQMPNAERQDAWFVSHPWMDGAKSAFEIFDGASIPVQAKFFWLKKKTAAQIAGSVHFTANWEDFEYTRQNTHFKVGIDFFLSPDAKSFYIVLSNSGKLRIMELSEKLNRTQAEIFEDWVEIGKLSTQSEIHSALWQSFQLQTVNSIFYSGVSDAFLELVDALVKSGKGEQDSKLFTSRLLGRLIFTWFLKKMNMVAGPIDYFSPEAFKSDSLYYKKSLEVLFFRTLNEPTSNRSPVDGLIDLETPYLNGGLFAPHENDWLDDESLNVPNGYFIRLFEHFSKFNFTVDESTPEFEQVAIDPEMLGRVFESLLATQVEETGEQARKAKGTFYTPREVVFYMCRESVANYLLSKKPGDEGFAKSVRSLIEKSDQDWAKAGTNSLRDIPIGHREVVLEAISTLRSFDPACGSGAFPLGLLSVLTKVVSRLQPEVKIYQVKSNILRNSIFGSDIEPMAIEIAKLRAWLALIVEESDQLSNVQPLPNLEFKFVCANSLIPLSDTNEINLFDNGELEVELTEIRNKYFETKLPDKKFKLKERFNKALKQETVLFGETERSSQLRTFNPFADNSIADFFDAEIMFGLSKFDIVIGNPPYVDYRKIPSVTGKALQKYQVAKHSRMISLYVYFFELGLNLLSDDGVLGYITPQQYLIYPNTKGLRDLIREHTLLLLADFARVKVFTASTYTFVTLIQAKKTTASGKYIEFSNTTSLSTPERTLEIPNPIQEPVNISAHANVISAIVSGSTGTLGSVAQVFCASSSTTMDISTDIDGPLFLAASDIFEWRIRDVKKRVTSISYPQHSLQKQHSGPVIYTTRMTSSIRAVLVEGNRYLGGKVNVIHGLSEQDLHGVTALLNSKLVNFWYREKYSMQHMQGGALPINTTELAEVPIVLGHAKWNALCALSESLASEEGQSESSREKLERLVCEMYGLVEADVNTIMKTHLD